MIILERQIPERILALEAAIRRISTNHEKLPDLHSELRSRKKGYKGELSFDYYLRLLPDDTYIILNQLRLPHKSTFFQIDSLLISEKFILIVEIKNHSGKLHYDHSFRQLTRIYNEVEQGYPYPISQVQRHCFQLRDWLKKNKFDDLPIEYLVVQSDPSSTLSAETKNRIVYQRVIHAASFLERLNEMEFEYRENKIERQTIKKLGRLLKKGHTPGNTNVLTSYGISKDDVKTGVQCSTCLSLPLKRVHGGWFCYTCKIVNKEAHLQAIDDYFLLISPQISNSKLRSFLHLPSRQAATRLILAMDLLPHGTGKARNYSKK